MYCNIWKKDSLKNQPEFKLNYDKPYLHQNHQTSTSDLQNAQQHHNSLGKRFLNFFPLIDWINHRWQINNDWIFDSLGWCTRLLIEIFVTNDNSQIWILDHVFHVVSQWKAKHKLILSNCGLFQLTCIFLPK